MRRSDSVVALVKALAEAQAEMEAPKKKQTAQIGTRNYLYADLAAVRDTYRVPLTKRGLVISHALAPVDGHVVLTTTLLHSSGEWIASDYPIPTYERPQEQGSALTYFKRYNVCALLDIVAEDDDDGKTAQEAKPAATPVNVDANAILDLAAEIQQEAGGTIEGIIKDASFFKDDKGEHSFSDPTDKRLAYRPKWLASTRKRLEGQLHKLRMASEPGAAEGAAMLT